jgi:hypothetical protein
MKINLTDTNGGYHVTDLIAIEDGAVAIKKNVDELQSLGNEIRVSVDVAHEDFDTANFNRVYEAIASYQKRLSNFNDEIVELIHSVNEYQEDKQERWNWD